MSKVSNFKHFVSTTLLMYRSLVIYRFIRLFFNIFGINPHKNSPNNKLLKKVIALYFRCGYESNFFKLKLIDAYSLRYQHLAQIISNKLDDDANYLKNYIYFSWNEEFIDLLNLSEKEIVTLKNYYIKEANFKNEFSDIDPIDTSTTVLIAGPLFSFEKIDINSYKYLVVNKPPPKKILEQYPGKIIVITGNEWAKSNIQYIRQLKLEFSKLVFFSVAETNETIAHPALTNFPQFPFGSCLMNLQRTLHASVIFFKDSEFKVEGYDFVLSSQIHDPWYKKNVMNIGENPLWSLGRHDYMLSFIFARSFFQKNSNYTGATVDIANKDMTEILAKFIKVYSNKILKL